MMNPRQEEHKNGNHQHQQLGAESIAAQATHDPTAQLGKSTTSQLTATAQILNISNETCQASNDEITTKTKTMKTKTKASSLIVKMINDVSKTISDDKNGARQSTVTVTKTKKITPTIVGGDECIGDFSINETYTTGKSDKKHSDSNNEQSTAATFADASKMRKPATILTKRPPPPKQIKGESAASTTTTMTPLNCELTAMSGEKISPASETTATTTTTTTPTKRISETKGRTTSAGVTRKSQHLRKNKCPAYAAHEISSTRATLANTTSASSSIYGRNFSTTTTTAPAATKLPTTTTTFSNKWRPTSIRCELLESKDRKQTLPKSGQLSPTTTTTVLSLAEQKAKLRSEFFKDIAKSAKGPKSSGQLVKLKTETEAGGEQSITSKRLLKRCTNLKLKIPNKTNKAEEQPPGKDNKPTVLAKPVVKLSLIEERKLKLTRKFDKQTQVKTASNQQQQQPLQEFRRVAQLVKQFDRTQRKMIVNPNKSLDAQDQQTYTLKPEEPNQRHSSPLSDEGCNLGQSPYSTDDEHDNEDNVSIRTASTTIETLRVNTKNKDKVARSASSDSALGLEVDEPMDATTSTVPAATTTTTSSAASTPPIDQQQKRRMTLTVTDLPLRPALLPLAEPTTLPDSPTPELQQTLQNLLSQTSIPTKVILKERVVEIPEDPLRSAVAPNNQSLANSRRESEQSCLSDYPFGDATPGVRYVRTPSVVVSDYSDDVMCGITLEEIEYFRAQRLRRRSSLDVASAEREGDNQSDVSASSSCSNLYYCGSTISALDGAECLVNGKRVQLERKISDCSTCSASGNEDETTSTSSSAFTITEDSSAGGKDIADLLAAQHLSSKRAKKVGGANELDLYDNRI